MDLGMAKKAGIFFSLVFAKKRQGHLRRDNKVAQRIFSNSGTWLADSMKCEHLMKLSLCI